MAKQAAAKGRASIFRGKEAGVRVQAIITPDGGKAFNRRRQELRKLYRFVKGEFPTAISDADVVEYLARGVDATEIYLRRSEP